ncbi:MAG: isocitrate lyase [Candidatus Obscuribacterales bacterium]|nr:isocitrate lyase [Candidatus Obscuribacterales bacterium]
MKANRAEIRFPAPAVLNLEKQFAHILTDEAINFLVTLSDSFESRRQQCLLDRNRKQRYIDNRKALYFACSSLSIGQEDWKAAPCPAEIEKRQVEITGPVDAKTIINGLNSAADVFMADFEDSSSPSIANMLSGQANLYCAVRRNLNFINKEGKNYFLKPDTNTVLMVRPRGWHLEEAHLLIDGKPISASLFDFGLFFFHNAREQISRGSRPYFYLPKLETHLEARLWNDVFNLAQDLLGIERGTIRATVLIETIVASYEMEAILFELKDHAAGLNAGRWDYIFSLVKRFRQHPSKVLPDRSELTMEVSFMQAYCRRLVDIAHRHGVHAIGGMSAFIPNRHDAAANKLAFEQVAQDKRREANQGFDGTWVAHPDLIAIARQEFAQVLGERSNQKERVLLDTERVKPEELCYMDKVSLKVSEIGARLNIEVSLLYLSAWLAGRGAVAIHNLMEDAATAEISRAQLWQWLKHSALMSSGERFSRKLFRKYLREEFNRLLQEQTHKEQSHYLQQARTILEKVVLRQGFVEFITSEAYAYLLDNESTNIKSQTIMNTQQENQEEAQSHNEIISEAALMEAGWKVQERWQGIKRPYSGEDVMRLRPSILPDCNLARHGCELLWQRMHTLPQVIALGAMTGAQAVQMAKAGLQAIYLSGWQVAADANLAGQTFPDQSLYPSNSAPALVRRLNSALMRHDQILNLTGQGSTDCYLPIVADAEAGFGGPLQAFELMKQMIEAGAAAVHFEDQLAAEKKCGHMGGKVLVPTSQFIRTLAAARMAADIMNVPTLIVARTDALDATLLTSDIDERDRPFIVPGSERTSEGFYRVKGGLDAVIARGLAYAPYADLVWFESSRPDLEEARLFAEAIHAKYPGKLLAYNCSPSFNWKKNLDDATIARFNSELGKMGYKFQFITLAGWHAVNLSAYKLSQEYALEGMPAYVRLQEEEFALADQGYSAVRHQAEVGAGWFDRLLLSITGGESSTTALSGSTESEQFHDQKK